jgi:citronellol/citronellal dehydrogenase
VIRPEHCRKVDIVADAAHAILTKSSRQCSGNFFIDEDVLVKEGIVDLSSYAVVPGSKPVTDLFLD